MIWIIWRLEKAVENISSKPWLHIYYTWGNSAILMLVNNKV